MRSRRSLWFVFLCVRPEHRRALVFLGLPRPRRGSVAQASPSLPLFEPFRTCLEEVTSEFCLYLFRFLFLSCRFRLRSSTIVLGRRFFMPPRRLAPLTDTQWARVFEMRAAGSSYSSGVTERAWQWLTSPTRGRTMSLRTQGEHTPAQGPTCRHKPRASRSAVYGRFATESRQRFPFVPLAMLPAPRRGTDARSRRSWTLQPLRGGAQPRSRCPLCVSCRLPEAVLPFVHATRRHLAAPDG
jgi:hypothetical protein